MSILNLNKKTGDSFTADEFNQMVNAINDKVEIVNGMGLSSNDYTSDDKIKIIGIPTLISRTENLESKIESLDSNLEAEVIADTERKCGKFRIGSADLDLYECTFKITNLPSATNIEQEYTISDDPLGNKTYIAVRDVVLTNGEAFYSDNYQVSKIWVDSEYRTRILVKCLQPLDGTHYAYIILKYVKFDGQKIEIKISGLSAEDAAKANLVFPPLKYDKKFAYSYTFDDCTIMAYGKAFCTINKKWVDDNRFFHVGQQKTTGSTPSKTLGYTDGHGIERRFTLGIAIWPDSSNSQIDNFMKPTNKNVDGFYPHLVWDDAALMLEYGNELYFHDINTDKYGMTISGILEGMKAAQRITIENTNGYGMKILSRPNGNNDYCIAARQYDDIVMMMVENGSDLGPDANITFDTDWNLKNIAQHRRYAEATPTLAQLWPEINTKALSGTYAWTHDFSHGPADLQYILDLFTKINDVYGKDGLDTVWFATLDEVYEYWFVKKFSKIRKIVEADGVRFTLFVPNLKYCRHRDFTLQLSDVAFTSSQTASLLTPDQVYGFSQGNVGGKFTINVNLEKRISDLAEKYSDAYVGSLVSEHKEDALYFTNQLRKELKSVIIEKISAAEVPPVLTGISINEGDMTTYTDKVSVVLDATGIFTHLRLSESADLSLAPWVPISGKRTTYTLSGGYGPKTLYAALKNSFGNSTMKSASITYAEITADTVVLNSVKINNGATSTSDTAITVNLSLSGIPTHYMISESPVLTGASWQLYSGNNIPFVLSTGNGSKTVYVKVKNVASESNIKLATITLGSGGSVTPPEEQNSKTIACFNIAISLAGYNGINMNEAQKTLKDTSGKVYITFLRNDTAGDSLDTRPGGSSNFNPTEVAGTSYPYEVYKELVCAYGGSGTNKYLYFSAKDGVYRIKIYANTKFGNEGDSDYRMYAINGEEKIPDFEVKGNVSNFLIWENVSPVDGKIKIAISCSKAWVVVPVNVIEFELIS